MRNGRTPLSAPISNDHLNAARTGRPRAVGAASPKACAATSFGQRCSPDPDVRRTPSVQPGRRARLINHLFRELLRLDSSRIVSRSSRRHLGRFWRVSVRGAMTLHLRESTIHEQFGSRDVATIVGCEKHDGLSRLIGRSEPSRCASWGSPSISGSRRRTSSVRRWSTKSWLHTRG
jgi:hypothetical protein